MGNCSSCKTLLDHSFALLLVVVLTLLALCRAESSHYCGVADGKYRIAGTTGQHHH